MRLQLIKSYNILQPSRVESIKNMKKITNKILGDTNLKYTLEKCIELSDMLENQGEEVVELYIWANDVIKVDLTAEEAQEYVQELRCEGYIILGDYLVYPEKVNTDKIARHILEEMLECSYCVDRLFDRDQLINMWMEEQEKDEVIDDLVRSIEVEENLEESIDEAYITSSGDVFKYAIADY